MASIAPGQIHVLGLGSLGMLLAHALVASRPAATITLLFHRPELASSWDQVGHRIDVVTDGTSSHRRGYRVERTFTISGQENSLIENLVVATKTYATVQALRPLQHRLGRKSTILFLQNGMGTIQEVANALFTQPSIRPQILAGVVNHGVYQTGPFSVVHAGKGNISVGAIGPLNEEEIPTDTEPSQLMLQCLTNAPALSASMVSRTELLHSQLDKLVVNAIINPLTMIFDCLNGKLFDRPPIRALIRALLVEISAVIQNLAFPTMNENRSQSVERFSPPALERTVASVAATTAQNSSSMRQDARNGKRTEIDCINGFIIAQGAERGIACSINRALVQLVHHRTTIEEAQISECFPQLTEHRQ